MREAAARGAEPQARGTEPQARGAEPQALRQEGKRLRRAAPLKAKGGIEGWGSVALRVSRAAA